MAILRKLTRGVAAALAPRRNPSFSGTIVTGTRSASRSESVDGEGVAVRDPGSTNGTPIHGRLVVGGHPRDGDIPSIATCRYRPRLASTDGRTSTHDASPEGRPFTS